MADFAQIDFFQQQHKENSVTLKEACYSETSEQTHYNTQRKDPEYHHTSN